MEAIVKQMLLGTAKGASRQSAGLSATEGGPDARPPVEGAPADVDVDGLVARVEAADAETRLLLAAGAWTVYELAGRKATARGALPEPAPEEDLPVPSARAVGLLQELFGGEHRDLLLEALTCLRDAGMRLPEQLLAAALDDQDAAHRACIPAVLGARGRWLSRFNPNWAWAAAGVAAVAETLPAEAEEIWDSGAIDQREALLRQVRGLDPAKAREWLQKSWPGEKAEHRGRLLGVLAAHLSQDDVVFLEEALADRAMRVRAEAAGLLVRVPGSAFVRCVGERVDACLSYRAAAGGKLSARLKSLGGRKSAGELVASPPEDVEGAWRKEGIVAAPPQGVGPRAWWLNRMIGLVPPEHWHERFGLAPAELLAASIPEEWATAVVAGCTQAALLHGAAEWLPALWDYWMGAAGSPGDERLIGAAPGELLGPVLARMRPEEAGPRIERLIHEGREAPFGWLGALKSLPVPWPAQVAHAYLEHVRRRAKRAAQVANQEVNSLAMAARALPRECFDEAMSEWNIPEGDDYLLQCWRREVEKLCEVVSLRRGIVDAMTCQ